MVIKDRFSVALIQFPLLPLRLSEAFPQYSAKALLLRQALRRVKCNAL